MFGESVASDEGLVDRMRDLLPADFDVTEMKMFGGLAFLVVRNLAVGAVARAECWVHLAGSDRLAETTKPRLWRGERCRDGSPSASTTSNQASDRQSG